MLVSAIWTRGKSQARAQPAGSLTVAATDMTAASANSAHDVHVTNSVILRVFDRFHGQRNARENG